MTTSILQGILASTRRAPAYGGRPHTKEHVENLANAIRDGSLPFNEEHDSSRPLPSRVREVELQDMEDGHWGVWVDLEIYDDEPVAGAYTRRFPISVRETLGEPDQESEKPRVDLAVFADQFDEATLREAAEALRPYFNVSAGRLHQFGFVDHARVMLELSPEAIQTVSLDDLTRALSQVTQTFVREIGSHSRSVIEYRVPTKGKKPLLFRMKTRDSDANRNAVATFAELASSSPESSIFELDENGKQWKKVR